MKNGDIEKKEAAFLGTVFTKEIESRVIQTIVIRCLSQIDGVSFLGGTIIDNLLGREGMDRIKGISVEQDEEGQSVSLKVEVNVAYGISIPEKAEEVQEKIAMEITKLTGLHVSCVHVVFKGIIPEKMPKIETEERKELGAFEEWNFQEDESESFEAAETE